MKFWADLVYALDKMTRWLQEKCYSVTTYITKVTALVKESVSFGFAFTDFVRFISLTEPDMTHLS